MERRMLGLLLTVTLLGLVACKADHEITVQENETAVESPVQSPQEPAESIHVDEPTEPSPLAHQPQSSVIRVMSFTATNSNKLVDDDDGTLHHYPTCQTSLHVAGEKEYAHVEGTLRGLALRQEFPDTEYYPFNWWIGMRMATVENGVPDWGPFQFGEWDLDTLSKGFVTLHDEYVAPLTTGSSYEFAMAWRGSLEHGGEVDPFHARCQGTVIIYRLPH